jgi:hypothetical protein
MVKRWDVLRVEWMVYSMDNLLVGNSGGWMAGSKAAQKAAKKAGNWDACSVDSKVLRMAECWAGPTGDSKADLKVYSRADKTDDKWAAHWGTLLAGQMEDWKAELTVETKADLKDDQRVDHWVGSMADRRDG